MKHERPLFIVLKKENFEDFLERDKCWEIRKAERGWNRKQVRTGRSATLACGYSGPRITGLTVGKVIFGTLEDIFGQIPWKEAEPRANNRQEALGMNSEFPGESHPAHKAKTEYVAFEVKLYF